VYIPDLSPCHYYGAHPTLGRHQLLAVGWLEPGHDFVHGPPDDALANTLKRYFGTYGRGFFAGGHHCGFCFEAAGGLPALPRSLDDVPIGYKDLFFSIPNQAALFAVPELITHYMTVHHSQPPARFCEAVAWRPPIEV
jgi:hypothetical protein